MNKKKRGRTSILKMGSHCSKCSKPYTISHRTANMRKLGYELKEPGCDCRQRRVTSFPKSSRPALGPTQSPIQWVNGSASLGIKRPRREADHSPAHAAEVMCFYCEHRGNFAFIFSLGCHIYGTLHGIKTNNSQALYLSASKMKHQCSNSSSKKISF
jgi:hypothetical protein